MRWVRDDMKDATDDELFDAIVRKDKEIESGAADDYAVAVRDAMVDMYTKRR